MDDLFYESAEGPARPSYGDEFEEYDELEDYGDELEEFDSMEDAVADALDADELDALAAVIDLGEEEDAIDAAAPVVAGLAVRRAAPAVAGGATSDRAHGDPGDAGHYAPHGTPGGAGSPAPGTRCDTGPSPRCARPPRAPSPATMRRGVLLSRLLGEPNPFPIVRIPWDRDRPWQATFLHEVAHNLQADLGIWQENRQAVIRRLLGTSRDPRPHLRPLAQGDLRRPGRAPARWPDRRLGHGDLPRPSRAAHRPAQPRATGARRHPALHP